MASPPTPPSSPAPLLPCSPALRPHLPRSRLGLVRAGPPGGLPHLGGRARLRGSLKGEASARARARARASARAKGKGRGRAGLRWINATCALQPQSCALGHGVAGLGDACPLPRAQVVGARGPAMAVLLCLVPDSTVTSTEALRGSSPQIMPAHIVTCSVLPAQRFRLSLSRPSLPFPFAMHCPAKKKSGDT